MTSLWGFWLASPRLCRALSQTIHQFLYHSGGWAVKKSDMGKGGENSGGGRGEEGWVAGTMGGGKGWWVVLEGGNKHSSCRASGVALILSSLLSPPKTWWALMLRHGFLRMRSVWKKSKVRHGMVRRVVMMRRMRRSRRRKRRMLQKRRERQRAEQRQECKGLPAPVWLWSCVASGPSKVNVKIFFISI